jgi:hypothetical protein
LVGIAKGKLGLPYNQEKGYDSPSELMDLVLEGICLKTPNK